MKKRGAAIRGHEKPVLYVFRGKPNMTKSTVAKRLSTVGVFESDLLSRSDRFDIEKFPKENIDVIVIGGRWYKNFFSRWYITSKILKHFSHTYSIILIDFSGYSYKTRYLSQVKVS